MHFNVPSFIWHLTILAPVFNWKWRLSIVVVYLRFFIRRAYEAHSFCFCTQCMIVCELWSTLKISSMNATLKCFYPLVFDPSDSSPLVKLEQSYINLVVFRGGSCCALNALRTLAAQFQHRHPFRTLRRNGEHVETLHVRVQCVMFGAAAPSWTEWRSMTLNLDGNIRHDFVLTTSTSFFEHKFSLASTYF